MGDEKHSLYKPSVLVGGEWMPVGDGVILEAPDTDAGEAVGYLMRSYEATFEFSEDSRLILISTFRSICKRSRSRRKAATRSRRNSGTMKRHAHGRAQRTRRYL
ncbi:hypothetical protein [Adlercreutzia caecimuris]|uniref:hypothetical protein n=1 Tax=Adlercreutzia caecimuris TaxID=671266 RepID=UPI000ECB751D|nr:hypothetical protein [Adlercreutzia caecimuris]NBJ67589.1 hypothetical protein [Adlercreutzia caecimuris]